LTDAMNRLIRSALGREPAPEFEREPSVGDLGLGRGGSAGPPPRTASSNADLNGRLRAAATITRAASVAGGVSLDSVDVELDDLLGRR
jgi:hypothetical protein